MVVAGKRKGWECEDKKRVELVLVLMFSLSLCVVLEYMGGIPGCPFNEFVDYQIKSVLSWSCKMFFLSTKG